MTYPPARRLAALVLVAAGIAVHAVYLAGFAGHFLLDDLRRRFALDLLFRDTAMSLGPGCDFFQFYQAGEDIRAGRDFFRGFPAPERPTAVPYAYPWVRYPPVLGYTLGLASTLVTPRTAYLVWGIVVEAALLGALALVLRRCADREWRLAVAALVLAWSPHYVELYMGQTSTVLGVILLALCLARLDGRPGAEAAAYAGGALLKFQTLVLTPVYVAEGRLRLPAAAALLVAATTAPYFLLHPAAWDVFRQWGLSAPYHQLVYQGNFGLTAVLAAFGDPRVLHRAMAAAVVVSSLLGTTRRPFEPTRPAAVWTLALLLAQPATYEHHYNLVLPVLLLEAVRSRDRVLLACLACLALPTPYLAFARHGHYSPFVNAPLGWGHPVAAACKALPALVAWGRLVRRPPLGQPPAEPAPHARQYTTSQMS